MEVSKELMEKFIRGECSDAERRLVWEYCRKDPDILEQYLTEESWNQFKGQTIPVPGTESMYSYIHERTIHKSKRKQYTRWVAAAAIFIAVVTTAWLMIIDHPATDTIAEQQQNTRTIQEARPAIVTTYNRTAAVMLVRLPDSSVVELAANSSLQYLPVFDGHARDIILTGKALFTVVKDAKRPFTVHAGNLATTALGTVFSVKECASHRVKVRLYSGRVVVKQESRTAGKYMQDVYLSPGDELTVDSGSNQPVVQTFKEESSSKENGKRTVMAARTLVFNNLTLPDILDSLQKEYHVRFEYNRELLQNMSFTGKLNRQKETLDGFINTICLLNQLNIKKDKNVFYITQ